MNKKGFAFRLYLLLLIGLGVGLTVWVILSGMGAR